jgi:prepilin-type processing-associated H-X9-DG protein
MIVDLTALAVDVPAPHPGGCNVLYSDGVVRRVRDPLKSLRGL